MLSLALFNNKLMQGRLTLGPLERYGDMVKATKESMAWSGMKDPVAPLRLAFYRHSDSGGIGDRRCSKELAKAGPGYMTLCASSS